LIPSASIVGSGELIVTTALGAQVGFVPHWLVIVNALVKVAVQVELARWTPASGQPALTGYNMLPPRIGGTAGSTSREGCWRCRSCCSWAGSSAGP
jgi:hypothetical protein